MLLLRKLNLGVIKITQKVQELAVDHGNLKYSQNPHGRKKELIPFQSCPLTFTTHIHTTINKGFLNTDFSKRKMNITERILSDKQMNASPKADRFRRGDIEQRVVIIS